MTPLCEVHITTEKVNFSGVVTCPECGRDGKASVNTYTEATNQYTVTCGACKNVGTYSPSSLGLSENGKQTRIGVTVRG